ncbi:MAG: YceK/YidQ family lipoprotein [Kiritimatiellae bacterium]|nr:YceK/YidQ family lipoprotein [Kiritimatiellia bacterium]
MRIGKAILLCAVMSMGAGCINIATHVSDSDEPAGVYRGTSENAFITAVLLSGPIGIGCLHASFPQTLAVLPICLVDLPLEVVADTITFPYDYSVSRAREREKIERKNAKCDETGNSSEEPMPEE